MARYIVTSGSFFNPFSYDELAKPLEQATEAHNETADAYDQMSMEASALEEYLQREPEDSRARSMYNTYMSQLTSLQDELWNNGYSAAARRGLGAARAGYAKNITRLQKAISDRQARSKEYWDYAHKNPDAIMGFDPGLGSLDNYLDNDMYGSDYYAYDGQTFMENMAADATARANEMLNYSEVQKNPELFGYLFRIKRQGFTNAEIDNAVNAAKAKMTGAGSAAYDNLTPAEKILADSLESGIGQTGAVRGVNVSEKQFDRFFDYGRRGYAKSVVKPVTEQFEDIPAKKQLEFEYWKKQKDYNPDSDGNGGTVKPGKTYSINEISTFLKSGGANSSLSQMAGKYIDPFESPIIVNTSGGGSRGGSTTKLITNPNDAAEVLSSLGRDKFKERWGGIDPSSPTAGVGTNSIWSKDSDIRVVEREISDFDPNQAFGGNYIVEKKDKKGRWRENPELTERFNEEYDEYQDKIKGFNKNNPGIDIQSLAISEADKRKIYKDMNIPDNIPQEYVPAIVATKSKVGYVTPATIAEAVSAMDSVRSDYANNIIVSWQKARGAGNLGKSSESAFYKANGYNIDSKAETDIDKVLGTKSNGKNVVTNDSSITSISAYPEDVIDNRIRFTTNSGEWAVNPRMLGNDIAAQINKLNEPVGNGIKEGSVEYMMKPILDPVAALQMTEDEVAQWLYYTNSLIGNYVQLVGEDNQGNIVAVTPAEIVIDSMYGGDMQGALRSGVTEFIQSVVSDARDKMKLLNFQTRSGSVSNPGWYNGQPIQ